MVVRRKIASLFADCADIKRTAFWKCGAVWVLWFDMFAAFERSTVFWQPRILGIAFVLEDFWDRLGYLCDLSTPGGFSPPSTPRKRLARRLTPRFLISRFTLFKAPLLFRVLNFNKRFF